MPPDLTAFAKQFDIQLLTHNDPKELLSEASFQEALRESIPDIQAHEWVPLWLLRYSVIVKSRGIIKSKGYIYKLKGGFLTMTWDRNPLTWLFLEYKIKLRCAKIWLLPLQCH